MPTEDLRLGGLGGDETKEHQSPDSRVLRKIFGVDAVEVSRNKAMIRLGVSNSDIEASTHIFRERGSQGSASRPEYDGGNIEKVERITGYAEPQLAREKAIQLLGTTEEDVDEHTTRALSQLGLPASFDLPRTTTTRERAADDMDCRKHSTSFMSRRTPSPPGKAGNQNSARHRAHSDVGSNSGSFSEFDVIMPASTTCGRW